MATYNALFLPDPNNCFFVCLVPYICLYFFLILYFYFHLFFSFSSLVPFHYNLPVILRRKEILHSPLPKKKFCVNYNQPDSLILSWNKVWVFPSSLSNYFLFSFWSNNIFLAHARTSHFNSMNFYNYFVTKRSLNKAPYRKFSLNCKQHSKTRKEHV